MATFRCISAELAAILTLLAAAAAPAADALTVDGTTARGELAGDGPAISLASAGGAVPLREIARIRLRPSGEIVAMASGVVTSDGSTLRGSVSVGANGAVTVVSPRFGAIAFPPDSLSLLCIDSRAPLGSAEEGVLFRNGDFLAAETLTLGATSVQTESALGKISVPLDRVAAVRLGPPPRVAAPPEAIVVLDNGDTLNCSLAAAGGRMTLETPFGRLAVEERFVSEIVFPARGAYVSDLALDVSTRGFAPDGMKYASFDAGLNGALKGRFAYYRKGFATRAGAAVEAALPAGARSLVFTPDIPAEAAPPAGRFSIERDGREIWALELEAGTTPAQVSLDVSGARRVVFVYQSKPEGLVGSAGVWGDAFVTFDGGEGMQK